MVSISPLLLSKYCLNFKLVNKSRRSGSGCGSVGRAVAFDTRGPRFDSSHWQNFIEHLFVSLFIVSCIEKTKINKKKAGNGPLFT